MELDREIEGIVPVPVLVPSLAALSLISLPGTV